MQSSEVTYRDGEAPEPSALHAMFRQEQWNDFYNLDEVAHHIRTAVHIVTAWDRGDLVGYGRLDGDGRLWAVISDVLVRQSHQGRGIGTELVRRLVEPIGDREVHLYSKFGFAPKEGCIWMELHSEKLARRVAEVRGKRA